MDCYFRYSHSQKTAKQYIMKSQLILWSIIAWVGISIMACQPTVEEKAAASQPNIIILITDDQGYGDLSCHGNPDLKTPHLDQLYAESVRFTDFHVGTTCAPSRASLMTGQYCNKVGAWHTINGRQMVWSDEIMLPELLKEEGYATGMFGKWHLGDTPPYRPQDRGFDEVLMHGGGGVGQTPDYWNNDYFDDTYFHNGKAEKKQGYCTDVWFEAALEFMQANKDKPFFSYISTNAPHGPFYVDTSYSKVYEQRENVVNANFYGMISNIDENLGRLRQKLTEWEIADNTILIFMTDNGSAAGSQLDKSGFVTKGYNAGMRGKKGSPFEGGHRVPLFIHWKDGKVEGGRDIEQLAANIDLAPTLLDWAGIQPKVETDFDGMSLRSLVENNPWEDRTLFADTQRKEDLVKYKDYSIMTEDWRLVSGQLFAIKTDPGQRVDVAKANPEVVETLMQKYEAWWNKVSARAGDYCYFLLGENPGTPQCLTQHDLLTEDRGVAWNQRQIRAGKGVMGHWPIEIKTAGKYRFDLRRWPVESDLKLLEKAPVGDKIPQGLAYQEGVALDIRAAAIEVGEEQAEKVLEPGAAAADFTLTLAPGQYKLFANFKDDQDNYSSAYYVYAERLE